MLQQTRASVVVGYFEKWLTRFPTIRVLAEADVNEVIKLWEGLGYYSRARNIHAAAQQIMRNFGGEIPDSAEELAQIRGLGPYTIGALLNFGFQKKAVAIDGNVSRVLSRYFLIEENIQKAKTKKRLAELAFQSLDSKEPWVTSEAWIELGATICTPKPQCGLCPLQKGCLGYQSKKAENLPIKSSPVETIALHRIVFVLESRGKLLVKKRAIGEVMADLYEFPYVEKSLDLLPIFLKRLKSVKHTFTRYIAHLSPYYGSFHERSEVSRFLKPFGLPSLEGYEWLDLEQLIQAPFSSGHRKILHQWIDL